jgi:sec-independent protein translocase protein TatB
MNIFSNIGITELIVILLLALLVVGPERLPEMGRRLAKTLREIRQAYENLTKDLGPELMSLEQTTREIRESVESVRSIPKDAVGSVIKAADLEDTVKDLKEVEKSLQQASKRVTEAGQMVQKPLDEAAKSAREVLKPAAARSGAAATGSEAEPVRREEEPVPSVSANGAAASVEQQGLLPAAPSDQEGEEGADG